MRRPHLRLHLPTVRGRMRSDPGPLLLMAVVVALTTALASAVGPVLARTSDQALADAVRMAGDQSTLVATFDRPLDDFGPRTRDPQAVDEVRGAMLDAHFVLPDQVASVVQPAIASVATEPLQLLDAGPGRYLSLAYLEGPAGAPGVRYVSGGPPRATAPGASADLTLPDDAPPWPVQVALSRAAATALGIRPGESLQVVDHVGRPVAVRVSGVFVPNDPGDPIWRSAPLVLHPARGPAAADRTASAAALVSPAAFPDLRLGVPPTDLTQRVTTTPRPDEVRWQGSADLVRALASLKASPDVASGHFSWDTDLDRVVAEGRAQVAAARGQAAVLLVTLLCSALLLLWQAADLVVRRRAHSVVLMRERGGTLVETAAELFLEVACSLVAGAAVGLAVTWTALGQVGWAWWLALPVLAALAAAVTGVLVASRSTDPRRRPANRTARRVAARADRLRRLLLVGAVTAVAALSWVALRERGLVGQGGGGPTAASAPVWWAVTGALLVIAVVPRAAGLFLDAARRTTGGVAFFVAARLRESRRRALPMLVLIVLVAELTFAIALVGTEQRGQSAGALLSVGGDARLTTGPGASASDLARDIAGAPGVRAAVAGRVDDTVPASSRQSAMQVQLVVVDAAAYEHLLAVSALPDSSALGRLTRSSGAGVPALLLGGPPGLPDGLVVPGRGGRTIPLTVVGEGPRVQDTLNPVIVVDADTFARAGGVRTPNTVWAVGPGAAAATQALAGAGSVALYTEVLAQRRTAALAAGLVRLAWVTATLMLLFAVLSVVLAAVAEADPRAEASGRLRSLGLRDRQLWQLLVGELTAPVLIGALAGLLLGLGAAEAMFGQMSLERITGQVGSPAVSVPPWAFLGVAVLLVTALVLSHLEWYRLRQVALGTLLRGGPPS